MYKKCEEILNKLQSEGKIKISNYQFPQPQELKLKLKDMLEDEVDEKYYLSDKMIEYISATGTKTFKNPDCKINLDVARPLTTDQNKRAGTTNYLSFDLPDNYDLNQVVRKYGVFDTEKSKHQAGSVYDENGLSPTLDTMQGGWRQPCIEEKLRIRKLTPKECWRLMGFDDKDYEKASKVNSNTQLYKQAGNSIVVNVLMAILKELIK